eukprot:gene7745-biopygen5198
MDMDSLFHRQWPSLQLEYKPCAQQKRGSNDCGIHMTAHFFADHTRTEIRNATTIRKRLRPFLASASHGPMDKGQFMREMVYNGYNHPVDCSHKNKAMLRGGSRSRAER